MVKAEADYTQKLVEQCMQELVHDFQDWYGLPHALNHADWQKCSCKPFLMHNVDDAKAANVDLLLRMRSDMCLLMMYSTCPSISHFDSIMAVGHLTVFVAFSIGMFNTVKYETYSAATVPLLMLRSVLMHKHPGCFPYMQVCCYICTSAP